MLWDKGLILGIRPYTMVGGTEEVKVWEGESENLSEMTFVKDDIIGLSSRSTREGGQVGAFGGI